MIEGSDKTAPGPSRPTRWRGFALSGVVVLCCASAVLYGMVGLGNSGAAACPAAAAATARLDPLIHGEVAAFGLSKPARMAPDLAFTGPDGKALTLADLKGRTVLLNFWATWCVPCRKEMPALDQLQGMLGGADFEVVAVNVDTARLERPKAFLKEAGVGNLAFYADPSADVLQQLKADGQFIGLPTTLLVDKTGCELGRVLGPAEWASPDAQALITAAKSG